VGNGSCSGVGRFLVRRGRPIGQGVQETDRITSHARDVRSRRKIGYGVANFGFDLGLQILERVPRLSGLTCHLRQLVGSQDNQDDHHNDQDLDGAQVKHRVIVGLPIDRAGYRAPNLLSGKMIMTTLPMTYFRSSVPQ